MLLSIQSLCIGTLCSLLNMHKLPMLWSLVVAINSAQFIHEALPSSSMDSETDGKEEMQLPQWRQNCQDPFGKRFQKILWLEPMLVNIKSTSASPMRGSLQKPVGWRSPPLKRPRLGPVHALVLRNAHVYQDLNNCCILLCRCLVMFVMYVYMFLDQRVPPQWYPPHLPKPRQGGLPFVLPFFFPSFLSPSLFPFFLPSFLRSYVSSTSPPQGGGDALQHYCNQVSFIFSLNPFCFYIHSSKLYICSYNLYRALLIDNHHTTTPHHRGEGGRP